MSARFRHYWPAEVEEARAKKIEAIDQINVMANRENGEPACLQYLEE